MPQFIWYNGSSATECWKLKSMASNCSSFKFYCHIQIHVSAEEVTVPFLWSEFQEVQDSVAQGGADVQIIELQDKPEWNYGGSGGRGLFALRVLLHLCKQLVVRM